MRALFFLLDGETNASSRHRVLQYLPMLRAGGIEPTVSRPVPEGLYQRLVEHGRGTQTQKAEFYGLFLAQRTIDVLRADTVDVAIIQRDLFPFGPPLLERLLMRRTPRLAYDTDDATYLRPSFTPGTPFQKLRRFDKVQEVVKNARWVSVATEPIAAWARALNSNVSVVPMAVDLREYDLARTRRAQHDGPVVIGWAGTAGGLRYLKALAPVLRAISSRHDIVVRVISGGYRHAELHGINVDARPWRAETALQDMASFDIGLVPLDDSPFERAKFPFKLLQYLALGVPAVCARVGVAGSLVRDGENGLLATSPDEWSEAINRLACDAALRKRLGAAGRQTVEEAYTVERVGPLLVNGLRRAAA
jgi:glycosyltransferase involved in cell wall biosynthesis